MNVGKTRRRALVLFAISLLWILLSFANRIPEPENETGVILLGSTMLVGAVLPLVAFCLLILLVRQLIRERGLAAVEKARIGALCLFLGPIGCLVAVFQLTSEKR